MIVFLHVHKTAGSTFQFILENSFGISACHSNHTKKTIFRQDDFEFARKFFPRMKRLAGHNLLAPMSLNVPKPFHVTFLREPVARVFSQYQDSVFTGGNRLSFDEFVRQDESAENWHVKLMAGERNLDKAKRYLERCDFVGLTEKFDLSLRVLDKLSPYRLNLNHMRRRTAPNDRLKQSLADNPLMVELVRERNQLDLALYDFAVKEVFPNACARAGIAPDAKVVSYNVYRTDKHWRYRLCHIYNLLFYRQMCKLRRDDKTSHA